MLAQCRMLTLGALLLGVTSLLVGCSLSGNRSQELVEARLRQQDDVIRDLERRLQLSSSTIASLQKETDSLRVAAEQRAQPLPPEQADPTFRVDAIELSSLMSGGIDRDQLPGDEQFTLLVTPKDATGNWLRATGELEIELFDFTRTSDEQRLGHWRLSRTDTGALWHQGVVGTGFQFTSPWQQAPTTESVHVHARLTTPDGRQFDTTGRLRLTPPVPGVQPAKFEAPKNVGRASVSKTPPLGWTKSEELKTTSEEALPFLPDGN